MTAPQSATTQYRHFAVSFTAPSNHSSNASPSDSRLIAIGITREVICKSLKIRQLPLYPFQKMRCM